MINYYLEYKTRKISSINPSADDIKESEKILFSIFTRYGDTIIAFQVIKEFIDNYPQKEYLILCPEQMQPYLREILPSIECITLNKRNFIQLIKVVKILKSRMFDIGFNPWSNGLDSCFLISFCNKFLFYKDFDKPEAINHYQVVRRYLKLAEKKWVIKKCSLDANYKRILICPQSTNADRSLSSQQLDSLIKEFNKMYNSPKIIIASMNKSYFRSHCDNFLFKKSAHSSKKFLNIVKQCSLIASSDSGPLHIALALKKDTIAIFNSTSPELVVNSGSSLILDYS